MSIAIVALMAALVLGGLAAGLALEGRSHPPGGIESMSHYRCDGCGQVLWAINCPAPPPGDRKCGTCRDVPVTN
jgi:hypothetical protein